MIEDLVDFAYEYVIQMTCDGITSFNNAKQEQSLHLLKCVSSTPRAPWSWLARRPSIVSPI